MARAKGTNYKNILYLVRSNKKAKMDGVSVDVVRELLASGMTYSQISSELKQQFPHILRGLSERSVRRFVKENSLKEVVKRDVVDAVKKSVGEVRT